MEPNKSNGMVRAIPKRWLLIAGALVALLCGIAIYVYSAKTIWESDKEKAARMIVAWYVEGEPLPGFNAKKHVGAASRPELQIYLRCDFVSPDVQLSTHPRVHQLKPGEDAPIARTGEDNKVIVSMRLESESDESFVVAFAYWSSPLGAYGFQFTFRKSYSGLYATREGPEWVS